MTRISPLAVIRASIVATILFMNNMAQTAAFFLPSPTMMMSSTFRSHIIRDVIPLHSSVVENMEENDTSGSPLLKQDSNGIYDLSTEEDHLALLAANPGKIIVLKFYAPWCRTCKGLEPKFVQVSKDPKYSNLPLLFAQMSVQNNKSYIKSLEILALPSIHINAGIDGIVENFPCGPRKIPILKNKIAEVVNSKVDVKTLKLKSVLDCAI